MKLAGIICSLHCFFRRSSDFGGGNLRMMSASVSMVWVAVSVVLAHVVPMFCHHLPSYGLGGSAGSRFTIVLNLISSSRMFADDPGLYAVLTVVAAVAVAAPAVATPVVGALLAAAMAAVQKSAGGWSAQSTKLPHSLKFPHPMGSSEAIEALQELESLRA
jgi:hypothetical protein